MTALTPEEAARLATLTAEVLADERPGDALGRAIAAHDNSQRPAFLAALYEGLCYRVDVRDYWLQYRMWKVFRALGPEREEAAYFQAAAAVRVHADGSGSGQMFREMYQFLSRRGRDREALNLFRYQMRHLPDQPAATPMELAALLRRLGLTPPQPAPPRPDACRVHPVLPAEPRAPWSCELHGGHLPYGLAPLAGGMLRPAISVAEFADAEVLLHRNAVVVLDRNGNVQPEWSVAEYPAEIRAWFDWQESTGKPFPVFEAEEAVLIADKFAVINICHTLLDHITRLAIYQRLGIDTAKALVIGPEARMPAQEEILRRAGVEQHLGIDPTARVRIRRLWVSSNCRDLRHAAHFGAPWAVEYIHSILGGQGTRGWRRLYISRGDAGARRVTNEAEVVAMLEPHGFEVVQLAHMPYAAQVAAFKQASHIVAPHGAGLTHLVLCPRGARVLEIFHPLYSSPCYAMQMEATGLDYAAMLGRDWESDAPEWNDPTLADVGDSAYLERHMRVDLPPLANYLATIDRAA